MGIMTSVSKLKTNTIANMKNKYGEYKVQKSKEKEAYDKEYNKERITVVRSEAKADAKYGGKTKRVIAGFLGKIGKPKARKTQVSIGNSGGNPWTDTIKDNSNNPWR